MERRIQLISNVIKYLKFENYIITMKENQKKRLRNLFDQDTSNFNQLRKKQSVPSPQQITLEKQELKKKILAQKQKNELRDEKIKQLKETHKFLLLEKSKNEEKLKKLTKRLEEMKHIHKNPSHLQELRQMFKKIKSQLGLELLLPQDEQQIDPDEMTYQQLLQLEQKIGNVSKGLNESQIKKLMKFKFGASQQKQKNCIICCYEFEQQSECLKLKCSHIFHEDCISEWLKSQKICPLCKQQTI